MEVGIYALLIKWGIYHKIFPNKNQAIMVKNDPYYNANQKEKDCRNDPVSKYSEWQQSIKEKIENCCITYQTSCSKNKSIFQSKSRFEKQVDLDKNSEDKPH